MPYRGWCFAIFPSAIPLEALSVGAACLLSFMLARRFVEELKLSQIWHWIYLLGAPVAVFTMLLSTTVLEMETPLAICMVLGGGYLFLQGSQWWLFALMLAAWTRYEYFSLVFLSFCLAALARRITWRSTILGGISLAIGVLWLLEQYGTLVPNTVKAKAAGYVIRYSDTRQLLGWNSIRPLLFAGVFVAMALRRSSRLLVIPCFLFSYGVLLELLYIYRKTFIFPWYPPLATVPIALGLLLGVVYSDRGWGRWVALCAALTLLPVKLVGPELMGALTNHPERDRADVFNARVREYLAVGGAIDSACPTARLMTSEIGALGEGFHGAILDGFGLATPAAIKYHPMRVPQDRSSGGLGAIPPGFVNEVHPDVIVSYDFLAEALVKSYDPLVYMEYVYPPMPAVELHQFSGWGDNKLYVWVAKTGVCMPSAVDFTIREALRTGVVR